MDSPIDLLMVDDDAEFRTLAAAWLRRHGLHVEEAANGQEALELADKRRFEVAVLDMRMPGLSGLELLERLLGSSPECEAIMLTGAATVETAVQAMKLGAYNYLTKPVQLAELQVQIERAAQSIRLRSENRQLKVALRRCQPSAQMIGQSEVMHDVFRLIERAGRSDKPILIQGESGTGKELVARAMHRASPRSERALVVINCAALPETLLESELFGYEKGAFTGAAAAKPGLFEVADRGTLFVDEIGELAGSLQAKLLRVLEDGSFRRIGSVKERRVNVRLLAATNRNLADHVQAGRFREDLYYRINVMSLELPPLRMRVGDIPGPDWTIEPEALQAMDAYHWPGNVRQLMNVIDRAKILADDQVVRYQDLPAELLSRSSSIRCVKPHTGSDDLAGIERVHIVEVMNRERGNKARAAKALGVNRRTLDRLLERHGILKARRPARAPKQVYPFSVR
ncbi:MAG: sigma-54-dependent Fis family transcriptional regulator [Planctomycetes bacterium]|nr:sigma-54-dependent Fis family transcriptional regulator [Planctomycetota bacterium]